MMRLQKDRWRVGLVCALGCLTAAALSGFWWFSRTSQPNILLITLDTTRADRIGAYGYASARTPVLDRLAAEGVLFEKAHSPAPLTLAVHASLLTGLYPPEHGLRTNGEGSLPADRTTLGEILVRAGYDSAAFVAAFVLDRKFGLDQGFKQYDDDLIGAQPTQDALHRFRDGRLVVDAALKWLGQPRSRPFFCWVHLYDPHAPYDAHAAEFGESFTDSPYDGEIAYTDRLVGRLMEFLKKHPDTIVIVAGDHGEGLGEHVELQHGYTLYNSTQHVPLILWGVKDAVPGTRVPATVSLVDVLPTLTELLKLRLPEGISGRSFLGSLRGKTLDSRACYGTTDDPFLQNGWSPLRSLTTERWKYIRTTKPELYDLQADPHEKDNLAASEPQRLRDLEQQLEELEAGMTIREANAIQLSPAEQRVLASLGYTGGKHQAPVEEGTPLIDVKDMLPFDVATQAAIDLMDQGKLPEAEAAFRKIVAESPQEHVSSRIYLAWMAEQQGRLDEAEEIYKAVLKLRPEHVNALFHLGSLYAEQGRYADAIEIYEKSLEVEPDSAQPHLNLGLARARLGELDRADFHFREAMQLDPAFPGVRAALGMSLARQGRVPDAIAMYESELALNPGSVESHVNLGVQLGGQQRFDEARQHFVEGARLAPANAEAQFNLGVCLGMQGEYADAVTHLQEAIRLRPEFVGVRTSLGNILVKLGRYKAAMAAYQDELTHSPNWVEAHVNLGAMLGEQKQFAEAIEHLEQAVRLAPDNVEAHFNLGTCYGKQGKLESATKHLEAVLRLSPGNAKASAELARIRNAPRAK